MEHWTDKAIKQHVEELIEESYLLTLDECEVREYLRTFVKSCEDLLRDNISIHGDIRLTKVKIALLKSYLIINRSQTSSARRYRDSSVKEEGDDAAGRLLARHVLQIKRSVLRLLESIDPSLVVKVLEEQHRLLDSQNRQTRRNAARRTVLVEIGYFALLFLAFGVLWVVLFR